MILIILFLTDLRTSRFKTQAPHFESLRIVPVREGFSLPKSPKQTFIIKMHETGHVTNFRDLKKIFSRPFVCVKLSLRKSRRSDIDWRRSIQRAKRACHNNFKQYFCDLLKSSPALFHIFTLCSIFFTTIN